MNPNAWLQIHGHMEGGVHGVCIARRKDIARIGTWLNPHQIDPNELDVRS